MKDSGVKWIGEIPDNWEVRKLKYILSYRNETNNPIKTDFILSLTNDRGVIPYEEKGNQGNISKTDLTGYKLAYPNDILVNCMNISIGSVGLSKYFGCISPVYYPFYINKKNGDFRFYNYLFHTSQFQKIISIVGKGIMEIRMRVSVSQMNDNILPFPPIHEQERIANFLDEKCEKIDSIISNEKSLIEKYKSYKSSLITETVTKGLNPNVEYKDTNIDYIGSIPKHWTIKPLKYVVSFNDENLSTNTNINYLFRYVDIGSVNFENGIEKYEEMTFENAPSRARRIVKKDDIIVSTVRTYLKSITKIIDDDNVIVSTGFAVLRPIKINHTFLEYICKSNYFCDTVNSLSVGVDYPSINLDKLKNIISTIPSFNEQKEIADYLDEKCEKIDNIVKLKEEKINKLNEYKKSLIYEYVTGKKKQNK